MFARSKARAQARIELERERFKSPLTPEGVYVDNTVMGLYFLAIVFVVLAFGILPKSPMPRVFVLLVVVAALSPMGRSRILPPFFNFMSLKFNWNMTYDKAVAAEREARKAEREGKTDAGAPAPAPTEEVKPEVKSEAKPLDGQGKEVLNIYFGMSQVDRREGVDRVLEFLQGQGHAFPELAEAENADERFALAQVSLKRLAKQNGLSAGGFA